MNDDTDRIGVIRQHRWLSADKQAERLAPRCRKIVSLDGGKAIQVDRAAVEKLARPGTVIELVHAFLLADPKRKRARGGMQADFRVALERLEKRGAVVVDVDANICSAKHRKAMLALADKDIARSNQGAKSATNGARSRGRPAYEPSKEELAAAKLIWRDRIEYPEWVDADRALRKKVNPRFTAWRAYDKWGGRTPPPR